MALGVATRRKGRAYVVPSVDPELVLGQIRFTPSVDHVNVDSYEVRIYDTSLVLVDSLDIGKPTVSPAGTITYDLTAFLNTIPAGDYTLRIAAINGDGETESDPTNAFSLPLS